MLTAECRLLTSTTVLYLPKAEPDRVLILLSIGLTVNRSIKPNLSKINLQKGPIIE